MNVLEQILENKREEIVIRRKEFPVSDLTQLSGFSRDVLSLKAAIKNGSGIIAEYKRSSPSAGKIQEADINEVLAYYDRHDISACSILTEEKRFNGKLDDLSAARNILNRPLLRKDFIVDEYQIFEAKAYGADAILLIAEALDSYHATYLTTVAQSLGLEVLMEFHSEIELDKFNEAVDVIGINNRNLKTLKTALSTSENLMKYLPYDAVKITESGVSTAEDLSSLYALGYDGCLVGEAILKNSTLLEQLTAAAAQSKLIKK